MGIAGLVLGILGLLFSWIPIFGTILTIVGLIISIIAVIRKGKNNETKAMGITGLILSGIGFVVSIITIILMIVIINSSTGLISDGIESLKNSELGNYVAAEAKLATKYAEVEVKNVSNEYTGYINKYTEEYTDRYIGTEIDDFYEDYLERKGYDYDVYVNLEGVPTIIKD